MATCIDAWYEGNKQWAVFEENGIAYTVNGLPDQDEADHVQDYHAGKFCPVVDGKRGRLCAWYAKYGLRFVACHDRYLAGKW